MELGAALAAGAEEDEAGRGCLALTRVDLDDYLPSDDITWERLLAVATPALRALPGLHLHVSVARTAGSLEAEAEAEDPLPLGQLARGAAGLPPKLRERVHIVGDYAV